VPAKITEAREPTAAPARSLLLDATPLQNRRSTSTLVLGSDAKGRAVLLGEDVPLGASARRMEVPANDTLRERKRALLRRHGPPRRAALQLRPVLVATFVQLSGWSSEVNTIAAGAMMLYFYATVLSYRSPRLEAGRASPPGMLGAASLGAPRAVR